MRILLFVFALISLSVLSGIPVGAKAGPDVLATVGGEPVTEADIEALVKNDLMKLTSEIYDIKRQGIDMIIENRLLEKAAKAKGITVSNLLKKEVYDKLTLPTDDDAKAIYETRKSQFKGKEFDAVKDQIKGRLASQLRQDAKYDYVRKLRAGTKVTYLLKRPRVTVSVDDDPSKGSPNAPVKLIEFSDFQCPFCKKTRPTLKEIMIQYKDKVYYVFRDFPLSSHKQAKKEAHAANCAGEQKKYWEYNDLLWENQGEIGKLVHQAMQSKKSEAEISTLVDSKLKEMAVGIKLDTAKFDACQKSGKYNKEIDKDADDGAQAGVSGTPAYFINGKFLGGAQPLEKFKELIDEELAPQ